LLCLQLLLPTDVVIADKFDPNANAKVVAADAIPDGWMVSHHQLLLVIIACCWSSALPARANLHCGMNIRIADLPAHPGS
jgi:hypothetical protein